MVGVGDRVRRVGCDGSVARQLRVRDGEQPPHSAPRRDVGVHDASPHVGVHIAAGGDLTPAGVQAGQRLLHRVMGVVVIAGDQVGETQQ
ncbi:hypothetical protein SDC9_181076 [bioreactor metagenome]|uniref:Uncharacterized protein n=1 Tax=bioreactor metagenome TaxID=1076179 RepID=A0A645H3K7_9ZZZZ